MDDKQIIIDDVDVSGCKHYKNRNCIADYCLTDMPFSEAKCELNPNSYYKQLQREKQNSQEARDFAIKEFNRAEELFQVLVEIKEIIHFNKNNRLSCGVCLSIEQILQKISEVLNGANH